jgi:hypothetical protein
VKVWLAHHLRRVADRLDDDGAPKRTNLRFTFEAHCGIVVWENGPGCPLWYVGEKDYLLAHSEAETEHAIVNWTAGTARFGR